LFVLGLIAQSREPLEPGKRHPPVPDPRQGCVDRRWQPIGRTLLLIAVSAQQRSARCSCQRGTTQADIVSVTAMRQI